MARLTILGPSGDTGIEFTPDDSEKARKQFDLLVKDLKFLAFDVSDQREYTQIRKFDPNAKEIVIAPPLVGG